MNTTNDPKCLEHISFIGVGWLLYYYATVQYQSWGTLLIKVGTRYCSRSFCNARWKDKNFIHLLHKRDFLLDDWFSKGIIHYSVVLPNSLFLYLSSQYLFVCWYKDGFHSFLLQTNYSLSLVYKYLLLMYILYRYLWLKSLKNYSSQNQRQLISTLANNNVPSQE